MPLLPVTDQEVDTYERRQVEADVLASAIESHPEPLLVAELVREMADVAPGNPNHATEAEEAIAGLVSVGLLHRVGDGIEPTAGGLRSGELELGMQ
jgi:hypothetical protein